MIKLRHNLIDLFQRRIYPAEIFIENERIHSIQELSNDETCHGYIMPGFVDAHIHIESSMMTPSYFAYEAVKHGTVATVSDPHEIANVCGVKGVNYMIENARTVPLKIAFGAPSCVPATGFETAGASLDNSVIRCLLEKEEIYYIAEVMNYPAVINGDSRFMEMIKMAQEMGKPVDGHAPALREPLVSEYFSKGICTDHECVTKEEAVEKINAGCKILIREGSAAKNFEALIPLAELFADHLMFCSDDKHPDELILGHINVLVKRAVLEGYNLFDILKMACINPVLHYKLPVGLMRQGDTADFIVVDSIEEFNVLETWLNGELVFGNGLVNFSPQQSEAINYFELKDKYHASDFTCKYSGPEAKVTCLIIEAIDGQIITQKSMHELEVVNQEIMPDVTKDILKCVVVNRYFRSQPAIGFVKNISLKSGAIVSSVTHDSHNIIAVGVDDNAIALAVNEIIEMKGGMGFINNSQKSFIQLEVAGLMTQTNAIELAQQYTELNNQVMNNGSKLKAPFMTLSFLALPVIPHLKMTDLGLFDVDAFKHVSIISEPSMQ